MIDHRTTPPQEFAISGEPASISVPVSDVLDAPGKRRIRQLLLGDSILLLGERGAYSCVRSEKDGYHGFVHSSTIEAPINPTHFVSVASTHVYSEPDLKSRDRESLSFTSRLAVSEKVGAFFNTNRGWVPAQHLKPVSFRFSDPVAVAEIFLGVPYLWGGNSSQGIDCSGLVQVACLACGLSCPADSDQQECSLGKFLSDSQPLKRGDIMFWKGHVAWMVNERHILHANVASMSVSLELLDKACERILCAGDGSIKARKSLLW